MEYIFQKETLLIDESHEYDFYVINVLTCNNQHQVAQGVILNLKDTNPFFI